MLDKPEPKSFPISRLPAGEKSPKTSYEVDFSSVTNTRGCQTLREGEKQRHRVPSDSVLSFAKMKLCELDCRGWRWVHCITLSASPLPLCASMPLSLMFFCR